MGVAVDYTVILRAPLFREKTRVRSKTRRAVRAITPSVLSSADAQR